MLETQSADEVPLPEFAFSKHSAETIERLKTEIGGNVAASFCNRVCGKKRQAKEEELGALSLQELLQPKKKKRSAKAKAQPKAATSPDVPQESSDSIKADVQQTGGVARKALVDRRSTGLPDFMLQVFCLQCLSLGLI